MGLALTIAGVILGLVALALAWAALIRAVPAIQVQPTGNADEFQLINVGPGSIVLRRASVFSPSMSDVPAAGLLESEPEGLFGWKNSFGQGWPLTPQHAYAIVVPTNHSLRIRYRAKGFLGFLSRAEIWVHGNV